MRSGRNWHGLSASVIMVALILALEVSVRGQTETILHDFSGADGAGPGSGLMLDSAGSLYGTTISGGNPNYCVPHGCGLAYRLSLVNGGWRETVVRDFPSDANGSVGNLISDPAGDLYGVTIDGGNIADCPYNPGCGTVFELSPTTTGQWKRTLLYAFTGGTDGGVPYGGLIFDKAGNLYGMATAGGDLSGCSAAGCGVIFKLSPHFGAWTETVLHSFTCGWDGCGGVGPLIADAAGNLYSAASSSKPGYGLVFELSPTKSGRWIYTVLHSFAGGNDGVEPNGQLTFDSIGNLYGTTERGGGTVGCYGYGCGTVFELSPNSTGGWTETVLYSFTGSPDGDTPATGVIVDGAGNLYGTTYVGGAANLGTAYELSPSSSGSWTEKILHSFLGKPTDGSNPYYGLLIFDGTGNLYGTAENGGAYGDGAVFEIAP